ncbi:MAG: InlB B-repeat-containing protein [Clostridiales Family XIII bacterium]|jgi:uncharacterized repeat protein (TIGR02543 family)|nr:InlB B-repeat-containing protein [Clostridiales Family XIII bacterium]
MEIKSNRKRKKKRLLACIIAMMMVIWMISPVLATVQNMGKVANVLPTIESQATTQATTKTASQTASTATTQATTKTASQTASTATTISHKKSVPAGYIGISTPQQLQNINNNLRGQYILMNNIDLSSVKRWEPIGGFASGEKIVSANTFSGIFDGNGYVISNLNIDIASSQELAVGLFGYVGGTIKNVEVRGTINAASPKTIYAGGIAGYSFHADIENCSHTGDITSTSDVGTYIGGIIGAANDAGAIKDCRNTGNLSAISSGVSYSDDILGMIKNPPKEVIVPQYIATFKANGGKDVKPVTIVKDYNTALGNLPAATRTGYKLSGWYTEKSGGTKISTKTSLPAKNITYYAHWTINQYTATFKANGGKIVKPVKIVKDYNTALGKLPATTRTGYKLTGWYTAKSGGTKISTRTKLPAKNMTYYAHWKKVT